MLHSLDRPDISKVIIIHQSGHRENIMVILSGTLIVLNKTLEAFLNLLFA